MKKIFLMVAVMIAAVSASFAQDFTLGVRVGMNVANIGGDPKPETDSKLGFKAGIVADFPLADNIYLEPGLYFSPKGAKKEYSVAGVTTKYYTNLDYLEIPINGVYKFEVNNNFAVRGHVGPYFGFGILGKEKTKVDGKVDKESKVSNFKDGHNKYGYAHNDYSKFDFGLNFGAGIEFSVCYLGVQYGMGFVDFNRNRGNCKMHNNVFSVDFGITF